MSRGLACRLADRPSVSGNGLSMYLWTEQVSMGSLGVCDVIPESLENPSLPPLSSFLFFLFTNRYKNAAEFLRRSQVGYIVHVDRWRLGCQRRQESSRHRPASLLPSNSTPIRVRTPTRKRLHGWHGWHARRSRRVWHACATSSLCRTSKTRCQHCTVRRICCCRRRHLQALPPLQPLVESCERRFHLNNCRHAKSTRAPPEMRHASMT